MFCERRSLKPFKKRVEEAFRHRYHGVEKQPDKIDHGGEQKERDECAEDY